MMNFVTNIIKKYIQNEGVETHVTSPTIDKEIDLPHPECNGLLGDNQSKKVNLRVSFLREFDPLYQSPIKERLQSDNIIYDEDEDSEKVTLKDRDGTLLVSPRGNSTQNLLEISGYKVHQVDLSETEAFDTPLTSPRSEGNSTQIISSQETSFENPVTSLPQSSGEETSLSPGRDIPNLVEKETELNITNPISVPSIQVTATTQSLNNSLDDTEACIGDIPKTPVTISTPDSIIQVIPPDNTIISQEELVNKSLNEENQEFFETHSTLIEEGDFQKASDEIKILPVPVVGENSCTKSENSTECDRDIESQSSLEDNPNSRLENPESTEQSISTIAVSSPPNKVQIENRSSSIPSPPHSTLKGVEGLQETSSGIIEENSCITNGTVSSDIVEENPCIRSDESTRLPPPECDSEIEIQSVDIHSNGQLESSEFTDIPAPTSDIASPPNEEEVDIGKSSNSHRTVTTKGAVDVIPILESQDSLAFTVTCGDTDILKSKMADLSEDLAKQQQENSELRLQLNALQQARASLELEVRQKEEIIIKSQAEALKTEQKYKQEIKILKEKVKENSSLIEKDGTKHLQEQLKEAQMKEAKSSADLQARIKVDEQYARKMEEFDRTLKQRADEYEKLKEKFEVNKKHLANLELAFSDVHSKYEKSKESLQASLLNEEALIIKMDLAQSTNNQHEERYESLRQHARNQIDKSNKELLTQRERYESEVLKLKAIIKRLEIKCSSLESNMQQKINECAQLAALCDEVTGKKV
ncbi:unnamed protein product [Phaedon cochleariae]|uniref:Transforming acidic coiled-coil-containing protein C-terminal domain-containing protein n=1 Tax=Phaedon cochleariae TaxID=80249 RepID=A0A9N9SCC1_PHACE|nr:unnamed protein product [Phaedon cochleariae]